MPTCKRWPRVLAGLVMVAESKAGSRMGEIVEGLRVRFCRSFCSCPPEDAGESSRRVSEQVRSGEVGVALNPKPESLAIALKKP